MIVLGVLILSAGPPSVQSISKIMRNNIRCQTEQQTRWRERRELAEARAAESELGPGETLSYPELRDLIAHQWEPHSQPAASQTKEAEHDIAMGSCHGLGSEWVDINVPMS